MTHDLTDNRPWAAAMAHEGLNVVPLWPQEPSPFERLVRNLPERPARDVPVERYTLTGALGGYVIRDRGSVICRFEGSAAKQRELAEKTLKLLREEDASRESQRQQLCAAVQEPQSPNHGADL